MAVLRDRYIGAHGPSRSHRPPAAITQLGPFRAPYMQHPFVPHSQSSQQRLVQTEVEPWQI